MRASRLANGPAAMIGAACEIVTRATRSYGPVVIMLSLFVWLPALYAAPDTPARGAFSVELYHQLAVRKGNLFLSPYSASCALGMTCQGARGRTADEIASALAIPASELRETFSALNRPGAFLPNLLTVANGLWVDKTFHIRSDFARALQEDFAARLFTPDFRHQPEVARQQINSWVADNTGHRIQNLIPPGAVDPSTRAVLANAIYFKGIWATPFPKAATHDQPFTTADGKKTPVPLMYGRVHAEGYLEPPGFQILQLAYASNELSMVIFLPRSPDGLPALEKQLTPAHLADWLTALEPREVEAYLPRFRIETTFQLNHALEAMGVRLAFTDAADFSGMEEAGAGGLKLSAVFQKAFIDVNEEGTEAAAATGVIAVPTAIMRSREPPVFRADHPFWFLIRDRKAGAILFMGRLAQGAS
ncbi:MAG TPA: serpin family protein [Verrucomicrobiae bacterium]|nr:serpin family protein [Verrucomicrobiae bacterium]